MGLLAVLNEVRGTKLSAKLRNAMAMYDLMKTNPALLSADWTNADDSRNYLPFFRQVSQEPRLRHARASRRRRAEAIRAPTPATPARGTTGVCTPPTAVFLPRRNASRWKRFPRAGRSSRHLRSFSFQRNKKPRAEKLFEALAHKRLPADGKSARREAPLHDANAGGQTAPAGLGTLALLVLPVGRGASRGRETP